MHDTQVPNISCIKIVLVFLYRCVPCVPLNLFTKRGGHKKLTKSRKSRKHHFKVKVLVPAMISVKDNVNHEPLAQMKIPLVALYSFIRESYEYADQSNRSENYRHCLNPDFFTFIELWFVTHKLKLK